MAHGGLLLRRQAIERWAMPSPQLPPHAAPTAAKGDDPAFLRQHVARGAVATFAQTSLPLRFCLDHFRRHRADAVANRRLIELAGLDDAFPLEDMADGVSHRL